jgi:hypothetical protein
MEAVNTSAPNRPDDVFCPIPTLPEMRRSVSGQRANGRRHRRHDDRLRRQLLGGRQQHIRPALRGVHQKRPGQLMPLIVAPRVQQLTVGQKLVGLGVLAGKCQSRRQRQPHLGSVGHRDSDVGTQLHLGGQRPADPRRFTVQPLPVIVEPFQRCQVVVAARDPAQPGVRHRRIGLGGGNEFRQCRRAPLPVAGCHGAIEMLTRREQITHRLHHPGRTSRYVATDIATDSTFT